MIATLAFLALAVAAVAGAVGVLLCRQPTHCVISFASCCLALAGLYALLNLQFAAAVQLALFVSLGGPLVALGMSHLGEGSSRDHVGWYLPAGLALLALTSWGIVRSTMAEPILRSSPMWAIPGAHIPALARELLNTYTIAFVLVGLLLLVGAVSAVHLSRPSRRSDRPEGDR